MNDFERVVKHVLRYEGGYVNDPRDPGGETKYGISKRAYPDVNIAALTEAEAAAIYRDDYWDALNCGVLPCPVGLILFDTAVNCGKERTGRWLQEEVNGISPVAWQVEVDGDIGPLTVTAAKQCDPRRLAMLLLARRQLHYLGLNKKMPQYFAGWIGRTTDLLRIAC